MPKKKKVTKIKDIHPKVATTTTTTTTTTNPVNQISTTTPITGNNNNSIKLGSTGTFVSSSVDLENFNNQLSTTTAAAAQPPVFDSYSFNSSAPPPSSQPRFRAIVSADDRFREIANRAMNLKTFLINIKSYRFNKKRIASLVEAKKEVHQISNPEKFLDNEKMELDEFL